MQNIKNVKSNMLTGNIFRSMVLFAIPIFFSSVFQQLYNVVDTIVVGHALGEHALASVGAAAPVYNLLMGFALGIGSGMSIVIARCFGSKEEEKLKAAVAAAIRIGIAVAVTMTVLSLCLLKPFLNVLNTPPEIFNGAYRYASTILACMSVMFAYNLCAGILRAIGNSVMPLVFLIISSILNIFLDIFFIVGLKMGVQGAAIATVISQGVSVVLCVIYIIKRAKLLLPAKHHFQYDKKLYGDMFAQGLSMALMHCFVSAGSAILQAGINDLGSLVIAGHTAAQKMFVFGLLPFSAMISATGTFVSQNFGAGKIDRIRQGMKCSYLYNVAATMLIVIVFTCFGPQMIQMISGSEEAVIIENGTKYLRIVAPFYLILGLVNNTRTALQAIGSKILPIFSSIIELIGKILFLVLLIPKFQYDAVIFCEPVIWCFMAVELLIAFWTNPRIKVEKSSVKNA